MKILENVELKNLTTMRLGGPTRYLIEIEESAEVENAHNFAVERNLPIAILGGGANTIAKDQGFDGVIIKNVMTGIENEKLSPSCITIMGGTVWDDAVAYACERGLTGIEALSKIPGLAGAAPVQNIGAYGQDISNTFVSAEVYDFETNNFRTLSKVDFGFAYRKSILNTTEKGRYFVISITLKLAEGEMKRPFYNSLEKYLSDHNITDCSPQKIREVVSKIRTDKLPDPEQIASAGSFFKNIYLSDEEAARAEKNNIPVYRGHDGNKINSGWLIEACGLKGQLMHGIRVSNEAALVLINESAQSYADLAMARAEIVAAVKQKFGYTLEQEPVEL